MTEEEAQVVMDKVAALLDKEGVVFALYEVEDGECRFRLRKKEADDKPAKFEVFGKDVFITKGKALSSLEQESLSKWETHIRSELETSWPPKKVKHVLRARHAKIAMVTSYWDGVLSGTCEIEKDLYYFQCILDDPFSPRVFEAYKLPQDLAAFAKTQAKMLTHSGWKHLVRKKGQRLGPYTGGEYPRMPYMEEVKKWAKSQTKAAYWFTYADTKKNSARDEELEYYIQLFLDNKLETWDFGNQIKEPFHE